MTPSLSLQAMIRGELDVLKDWCYEAVSSALQFYKTCIMFTDISVSLPHMVHFATYLGLCLNKL